MKVLITGIAGTGKSTIAKALNGKGIQAIDLHDVPGVFFWQDKKTKMAVEYAPVHSKDWFDTVDRLCDIGKVKEMLEQNPAVVMVGSTSGSNQNEFFSLFDKIILLQSNPETLVHRMRTRVNKSGYGKTEAEQEDNIEWQKEYDPLLLSLGAIPVNTEGDLDGVVGKIIEIIKSD
ncbi:MAG TPA: AAA family ATPase [Candidatus Paceibacterota bacterium]|nr:AAA family ATPase [Candidatus Paceibacterota bacterium]